MILMQSKFCTFNSQQQIYNTILLFMFSFDKLLEKGQIRMKKKWGLIFNRVFAVFPLTLILSSCYEDLKLVEDFGLTSASIKGSSTKMLEDIYDSCTRLEVLKVAYSNVSEERKATLSSSDSTQPSSTIIPIIPDKLSQLSDEFDGSDPSYKFPPARIKAACQKEKVNSEIVTQLNGVLVTYVETIGRLASRNTVDFDQNLQAIKSSIIQIKETPINSSTLNLTDAQRQAIEKQNQQFERSLTDGLNIAQSLLNLSADQKRYKKLKPIVICSNNSLIRYINALESLVKNNYLTGAIHEEENQIDMYFDVRYRLNMTKFKNNPERLDNELVALSSEYEDKTQEINKKKEGTLAYFTILQQTAATHNALANQFKGDMNPEVEKAFCANYFPKESQQNYESQVQTRQLDSQQIQGTRKILRDYVETVKPLAKKLKQSF